MEACRPRVVLKDENESNLSRGKQNWLQKGNSDAFKWGR